MAVSVQELYVIRLALALLEKEDGEVTLNKLQTRLAELQAEKQAAHSKYQAFKHVVDKAVDQLDTATMEDRNLDRNFRNRVQEVSGVNIDSDTLKVLVTLYKQRYGRKRSSYRRGSMSISRRSSTQRRSSVRRRSRYEL